MLERRLDPLGAAISFCRKLIDAAAADGYQSELCGHKEPIGEHQYDHQRDSHLWAEGGLADCRGHRQEHCHGHDRNSNTGQSSSLVAECHTWTSPKRLHFARDSPRPSEQNLASARTPANRVDAGSAPNAALDLYKPA